jgi:hypothetical protein
MVWVPAIRQLQMQRLREPQRLKAKQRRTSLPRQTSRNATRRGEFSFGSQKIVRAAVCRVRAARRLLILAARNDVNARAVHVFDATTEFAPFS